MNTQAIALILKKPSDKKMLLAFGVLSTVISTAVTMPVRSQDSYLPPEVIPVNQAVNYGSNNGVAQSINSMPRSMASIPGQSVNGQVLQTPQEARQAMYNSLMGNNVYPQFNNQTNNQNLSTNQANQANQASNSTQTLQTFHQDSNQPLSNQTAQSVGQENAAPPQTQTLSGVATTQSTSQQRNSGGFSKLAGLGSAAAMSGVAATGIRSGGGAYSAGLLGLSLINYGLRSGFKF